MKSEMGFGVSYPRFSQVMTPRWDCCLNRELLPQAFHPSRREKRDAIYPKGLRRLQQDALLLLRCFIGPLTRLSVAVIQSAFKLCLPTITEG